MKTKRELTEYFEDLNIKEQVNFIHTTKDTITYLEVAEYALTKTLTSLYDVVVGENGVMKSIGLTSVDHLEFSKELKKDIDRYQKEIEKNKIILEILKENINGK